MHTLFGTYCFLYKIKKKLTFTYTLFRKFTDFRTHFSNLRFFARMKTSLNKAQFPSTVAQECCNPATLLYYSFSFAKLWSKTKGKPIVLIASFPIGRIRFLLYFPKYNCTIVSPYYSDPFLIRVSC